MHLNQIKAIGFDLFNTLITAESAALREAVECLMGSLAESGLDIERETFRQAHREAAFRFIQESQKDGRETHNRFWISAALKSLGYHVEPYDSLISKAVEAYFSVFYARCRLIPDTHEMLNALKGVYRIGLLSNFTHPPAAWGIIGHLGLSPFLDVVLISGELGYRKPHLFVFQKLVEGLGVDQKEIIFIGDDLEPDIHGARQAGIQPVWMTYVRDNRLSTIPGYDDNEGPDPGDGVPRISNWKELFTLLKQ